ncbi:MAG TPA: carbohydrate ABC transporter permease [Thermoflexales bacterium]|jgi:multiple sugar transport system permease protein|nr:carbohydrate ABC transporter permease [Anaerolineae bacterium]HQV29222.1 carbohydrate ABC transporter permease [Thermoflexales bacterium]HQX11416.1 carbohydrate ABC transporter permease [Thermoflexales bacterium]HQY25684.1 carbohydrate ABC transporter permease [Thermoflexales bacterium]HQZ54095.1 carbohydrate ABC transporter permease [Thermoflexales bacterium]
MKTASGPWMATRASERALGRIGLYAALALAMFFAFFPIYWMLVTSLRPNAEVFAFPPTLLPQTLTLEHYANFIKNPQLLVYLGNSVLVATTTALGSLIISVYAAYSFSKFRYTGRRALMFLVLSAQMFPQALLLISLYLMFSELKMLDTYAVLVLSFTTFTLPLCIWMLKGYFDHIPTDLIEAAKIDGAGQMQIIHRILVPIVRPALVATGIFAFMRGWNDFIYALTLVGKSKQTLPPGLVLTYIGEFQSQWADMMAASLLVSLPLVIAFILFQRQIVSGLTAGAVKG